MLGIKPILWLLIAVFSTVAWSVVILLIINYVLA